MRSLVLALLFSFSAGAAELRFFSQSTTITPGMVTTVFAENTGEEASLDLVLEIQTAEGLGVRERASMPEWTCTETQTTLTCRLPKLDAGRTASLEFETTATTAEGGRFFASATLEAKDVAKQTIIFDVIAAFARLVTTTNDFGAGSLRTAIEDVNGNPLCGTAVPCTITFKGSMSVAPTSALPPIRKCNVLLAGDDFWEIQRPVKTVEISGANATHGNGLEIRATCASGVPGVTILGIAVNSWPGDGIYVSTPAAHADEHAVHVINRTYVGTDVTGTIAKPNRGRGIAVESPHDQVAIGALVSGNGRSGIALIGAQRANVGASIGVDRDGNPMSNGASGIFTWGTPLFISHSTIAYNAHYGIAVARGTSDVKTDWMTIHSNGGLPIDFGMDDRTPSDDETDGVLNAPRITNIVWEPFSQRVIITGVVRLRGERVRLSLYRAANARGDVLGPILYTPVFVSGPPDGSTADVPFEIVIQGDFFGKLLAVQAVTDAAVSEISEGVEVK